MNLQSIFRNDLVTSKLLDSFFLKNEIWRWLAAFALFIAFTYAVKILIKTLNSYFEGRNSTGWRSYFSQFLGSLRTSLVLVFVAWLAIRLVLQLSVKIETLLDRIALCAVLSQIAIWSDTILQFQIQRKVDRTKEKDIARTTALGAVGVLSRTLLWLLF